MALIGGFDTFSWQDTEKLSSLSQRVEEYESALFHDIDLDRQSRRRVLSPSRLT